MHLAASTRPVRCRPTPTPLRWRWRRWVWRHRRHGELSGQAAGILEPSLPSSVSVRGRVSRKREGNSPKSSIFYRVFHYKPSILGYPYFWKRPYMFFSRWWFQIFFITPAVLQDSAGCWDGKEKKIFFIFTPNPWGNSLQFDYIIFFFLSKGLVQPPTRKLFSNSGLWRAYLFYLFAGFLFLLEAMGGEGVWDAMKFPTHNIPMESSWLVNDGIQKYWQKW